MKVKLHEEIIELSSETPKPSMPNSASALVHPPGCGGPPGLQAARLNSSAAAISLPTQIFMASI
jgi:hypothetical protein